MISIVMPYWQRQWAATVGIDSLVRCYGEMDLELVVVDDGSPEPYRPPKRLPWPVQVIRMPDKTEVKNPCVPINRGVEAANGEIICLTGPEMIHYSPILPEMLRELDALGEDGYVLASVWSVDQGRWNQHSSHSKKHKNRVSGIRLKCGLAFHFFSVMRRSLWDRSGGLDEDYRDGAGYDDPDFALRLMEAGAKFCLRDDLVVWHPREKARANWTQEMFERNREIFVAKWEKKRKPMTEGETA